MNKISIMGFIFILLSTSSMADLDAGEDIIINDYLVDFGYSPKNPKAQEEVLLAFNLINDTTQEIIVPSSVWIRITQENTLIFSGTFHPEANHVSFSTTLPQPGMYEIRARFNDNKQPLVETDFPLLVGGTSTSEQQRLFTFLVVMVMLLGIILLIKTIIKKKVNPKVF